MSTPSDTLSPDTATEAEAKAVLREAREAAGWSLKRAGEEFGTHGNTIWKWESEGEHGVGVDQLRYLATLARRAPAAAGRIGQFVGIAGQPTDALAAARLELMRRAHALSDNPAIEGMIRSLDSVVGQVEELNRLKTGTTNRV